MWFAIMASWRIRFCVRFIRRKLWSVLSNNMFEYVCVFFFIQHSIPSGMLRESWVRTFHTLIFFLFCLPQREILVIFVNSFYNHGVWKFNFFKWFNDWSEVLSWYILIFVLLFVITAMMQKIKNHTISDRSMNQICGEYDIIRRERKNNRLLWFIVLNEVIVVRYTGNICMAKGIIENQK